MSKIRVAVWGTTGKSVAFDPNATVGAQIGVNLLMPDGSVATLAKLISSISSTTTSGSSSGVTAHRLLSGLALGDDHPQYTRRDILTTRGDLYVEGASALQRLAVGTNHQVLMSNGTDPGWVTLFANPTASVGLTAVNGTANTAMRSDGAPALDQGIVPTWTGQHTFSLTPLVGAVKVVLESRAVNTGTGLLGGGALTGDLTLSIDASHWATVAFTGAYSDLTGKPTIPADISSLTYLTVANETGSAPNSRRVLAGTNVTFDDTVSGVRTINASGAPTTVADFAPSFLLMGG